MAQHIDHIFYINLDRRTDRKQEMEQELERMSLTAERFSAIECPPPMGILGCGKSHLQVIKMAKERGYKNVLILEDDFIFTTDRATFDKTVAQLFEESVDFDVCFISYNLLREQSSDIPFLKRALESNTASGYIVNAKYYDTMINLYEWAMPLLESTREHWHYANDQCWTHLQDRDKWYCIQPRLGIQSAGFSDNSSRFIDRGV